MYIVMDAVLRYSHTETGTEEEEESMRIPLLRNIVHSEACSTYGCRFLSLVLEAHEKRISAAIGAVAIGDDGNMMHL